MTGEQFWKMQSQRLAKSCTVKKKLLLVENEDKLEWTNCLHPAPKNQRKHLWQILKKQDPKNWMQSNLFLWKWHCFQSSCFVRFCSHDRGEHEVEDSVSEVRQTKSSWKLQSNSPAQISRISFSWSFCMCRGAEFSWKNFSLCVIKCMEQEALHQLRHN